MHIELREGSVKKIDEEVDITTSNIVIDRKRHLRDMYAPYSKGGTYTYVSRDAY